MLRLGLLRQAGGVAADVLGQAGKKRAGILGWGLKQSIPKPLRRSAVPVQPGGVIPGSSFATRKSGVRVPSRPPDFKGLTSYLEST